jgi:protein TonB
MGQISLIGKSLCFLLWGLLLPAQLFADNSWDLEQPVQRKWKEKLDQADTFLIEENWVKADKVATSITKKIVGYVTSGGSEWLGAAATIKAVAAAGSGREDDAIWYWDVARQLFPSVEEIDLSRYGEAGTFLLQCGLPRSDHDKTVRLGDEKDFEELVEQGVLEIPKEIKSPLPKFPQARRKRGVEVTIELEAIVDEQGRLQRPIIVESAGEITMVYSALETLRKWRFEPAKRDGRPIRVLSRLKVNFSTEY